MKYETCLRQSVAELVAPHWGAWIEINPASPQTASATVAPHWGAWIEIALQIVGGTGRAQSHPTGVRGLKYPDLQRQGR